MALALPASVLGLLVLQVLSPAEGRIPLQDGQLSLEAINQEGTGRVVLSSRHLRNIQGLANKQGGSTVHRFKPTEIFTRIFTAVKSFPGLEAVKLVIPESTRQTRSQHASTIAEIEPGVLLAAWFGGTWERAGDVGIWLARYDNTTNRWGEARQVAFPQPDWRNPGWMAPCWNPVLFHQPDSGITRLFYKVLARGMAVFHHLIPSIGSLSPCDTLSKVLTCVP